MRMDGDKKEKYFKNQIMDIERVILPPKTCERGDLFPISLSRYLYFSIHVIYTAVVYNLILNLGMHNGHFQIYMCLNINENHSKCSSSQACIICLL